MKRDIPLFVVGMSCALGYFYLAINDVPFIFIWPLMGIVATTMFLLMVTKD